MFKLTLLFLTLSGLQAVPIAAPRQKPSTHHGSQLLKTHNLIPDHIHQVPVDVPAPKNGGGWVRVEESLSPRRLPDGFRQGTERFMHIPDGFRQGTERFMHIPDGFRQGTERFMHIPDGFRQGTELFMPIRDGFKQGTELFMPMRHGFRQGTEPLTFIQPDPRRINQQLTKHLNKRDIAPDHSRQGPEGIMRGWIVEVEVQQMDARLSQYPI